MSDQADRTYLTTSHTRAGVLKWAMLVVLLCAAASVVSLPFPAPSWSREERKTDERVKVAGSRLFAVQVELRSAFSRYRAQATLDRWLALPAARREARIVIDETVPSTGQAALEAAARAQWALVTGHDTTRSTAGRATLFITLDTSSVAVTSSKRPLRATEAQYFALPSAGRPCIAMIRVRQASEVAARGVSLGPCAFYAQYGAPGDRIRAWLESTGGTMALRTDSGVAQQMESRDLSWTALGENGAACLIRGGDFCLEALGVRDARRTAATGFMPPETPLSGIIGSGPAARRLYLGERSRWFLSDVARDIGPERFRTFWRSSESPEVAFRMAADMPLEEWTQRWLRRGVNPVVREAGVRLPNVAWLVLALPFLLAIAVRPRERIFPRPSPGWPRTRS